MEKECDREGLKARLRAVLDGPIAETPEESDELSRQLAEVCPDETLRTELLDEIDHEDHMEFEQALLAKHGMTVKDLCVSLLHRCLSKFPLKDLFDVNSDDEKTN